MRVRWHHARHATRARIVTYCHLWPHSPHHAAPLGHMQSIALCFTISTSWSLNWSVLAALGHTSSAHVTSPLLDTMISTSWPHYLHILATLCPPLATIPPHPGHTISTSWPHGVTHKVSIVRGWSWTQHLVSWLPMRGPGPRAEPSTANTVGIRIIGSFPKWATTRCKQSQQR